MRIDPAESLERRCDHLLQQTTLANRPGTATKLLHADRVEEVRGGGQDLDPDLNRDGIVEKERKSLLRGQW
jgi:hypothetical protein